MDVAGQQRIQPDVELDALRLDARGLVVHDQALHLERPGERAAGAVRLDPHIGNVLQLRERPLQARFCGEHPMQPDQGQADEDQQRDDRQDPAPAHHSTCVMLRCRRGLRSGSDSACATSMPISNIGSLQRTPMPTEYSSGVLQSLNALPVS